MIVERPIDVVIILSFFGTLYIAYRARVSGLESERERENYLNSRLEEASYANEMWGLTIDNIRFVEKSGLKYQIKKFIKGGIDGEAYVVVRWENIQFDDDFWNSELMNTVFDAFPVEVEFDESRQMGTNVYISAFSFYTSDIDEIKQFFKELVDMHDIIEKYHMPNH